MQVIVTVKERYREARQFVWHDLSGEYVIQLPEYSDTDTATIEAIQVCRESLAIENDELFELTGRIAA